MGDAQGGSSGQRPTSVVLVPGAWMGGWIWAPAVAALRGFGHRPRTLTLAGLRSDPPDHDRASVRLADHVAELVALLDAEWADGADGAVLVSHSYSATVTAQAADRRPGFVRGLIHVGGFLPVHGRALIDDWGTSDAERAAERAVIAAAGGLWAPPTRDDLAAVPDLAEADRARLTRRLVPHPGRTVTDPAVLSAPLSAQPTTYVALGTGGGSAARADLPPPAREARRSDAWRVRALAAGHWPMLTAFDDLVRLLDAEIRAHTA